jgi:Ca2+-binding RTX toxin-like protein
MPKLAAGSNVLRGTKGPDQLTGTSADDTIYGRHGNDNLIGGFGNDSLFGERGNDDLTGGEGDDRLFGGRGDDRFNLETGDDLIDGGAGMDTAWLSFMNSNTGIEFALTDHMTVVTSDGTKTLLSIEAVQLLGSEFADVITGGHGNDLLIGLDGDDRIAGGAGADLLHGGLGNNILTGGAGADEFSYTDSLPGYDVITDFNRAEGDKLLWTADADFTGRIETEWLFSIGAYRPDLANQGQLVLTENGDGTYTLTAYHFWATGPSAQVQLNTSVTAADFVGVRAAPVPGPTEGRDNFVGTQGADVVDLLGGDDFYNGLGGDDIISGGAGRDILTGGDGEDIFRFGSVGDTPTPGATGDPMLDHLNAANTADVIKDFAVGFDLIDLSAIDADTTSEGDQGFTLVEQFTGQTAGELRIVGPAYDATHEFSSALTLLQGDVDGDGVADFTIALGNYEGNQVDIIQADLIL